MGFKPKQKQEQVNRCSWAILCSYSILVFTVVMSGCTGASVLPLGDEHEEFEATSLDVDASWAKARHMLKTLFGVFFEVYDFISSFSCSQLNMYYVLCVCIYICVCVCI
jgi:hypothetical protein